MFSELIVVHILNSLSILFFLISFVLFVTISIDVIKKDAVFRFLSVVLAIYFIISLIFLLFLDHLFTEKLLERLSIAAYLGITAFPISLIVGIPKYAVIWVRKKKYVIRFFIGLLLQLIAIAFWLIVHNMGYNPLFHY